MGKRRWPFVLIVPLQQTWRQVCSTERRPFRAEPCLFCAGSRVQTPTSVNTEGKAGSPADICESLTAATNHTGCTCRWLRVEATPEAIALAFPKTTRGALMHYYGSHLNVNVAKCLTQIGNVPKRSQEETQQQQEDSVQTDSTRFSAHTLNGRPRIRTAVSSTLSCQTCERDRTTNHITSREQGWLTSEKCVLAANCSKALLLGLSRHFPLWAAQRTKPTSNSLHVISG